MRWNVICKSFAQTVLLLCVIASPEVFANQVVNEKDIRLPTTLANIGENVQMASALYDLEVEGEEKETSDSFVDDKLPCKNKVELVGETKEVPNEFVITNEKKQEKDQKGDTEKLQITPGVSEIVEAQDPLVKEPELTDAQPNLDSKSPFFDQLDVKQSVSKASGPVASAKSDATDLKNPVSDANDFFNQLDTKKSDNSENKARSNPDVAIASDGLFSELDVSQSKGSSEQSVIRNYGQLGGFIRNRSALRHVFPEIDDETQSVNDKVVQFEQAAVLSYNLSFKRNWRARVDVETRYDTENESVNGIDLLDAYIDAPFQDKLRIKLGRQVVNWGESIYFQLLDRANPRDLREPGYVSIDNIRLPIAAAKLSLIEKRWGADLVFLLEQRGDRTAQEFESFDPYQLLRRSRSVNSNESGEFANEDVEWLARLFVNTESSDISIIGGQVLNKSPILLQLENENATSDQPLTPYHAPLSFFGISFNRVLDSLLLRGEFVRKQDTEIQLNPFSGTSQLANVDIAMLGFDYAVNQDIGVSFEGFIEWIADADFLPDERSQTGLVLDLGYEMFRDTTKLGFQWRSLITNKIDILRTSWNYNVSDSVDLGLGYVNFIVDDENSPRIFFDSQDRAYIDLRVSF